MKTRTHVYAQHAVQHEHGFDVVCGMEIHLSSVKHRSHYHDMTYYFCSANCRQHFENTPTRYVWEK